MSKPFAVVTGASGGIGRELATQFAGLGHDVLLAANTGSLDEAAAAVGGAGGAVVDSVHTDLATFDVSRARPRSNHAHAQVPRRR